MIDEISRICEELCLNHDYYTDLCLRSSCCLDRCLLSKYCGDICPLRRDCVDIYVVHTVTTVCVLRGGGWMEVDGGRVPMSYVDYNKWQCHPGEFKKSSCRHVNFKKVPCPLSLSF